MRQGDKGTVFVSSLFVSGNIYAVTDQGGKRTIKTIAEKLFVPNGIEFHKGSLYVATPKDITRYDDIEGSSSRSAPTASCACPPARPATSAKTRKAAPSSSA